MSKRQSKNYNVCKKYTNQHVMIKTAQGVFQGKIVKVDQNKVYLQTEAVANNKANVHISFFPVILPLVLFELLVIVLLDRPYRPYYPWGPGRPY